MLATTSILQYLTEANLCLLVFCALYYLLLKKNTFFQTNRIYLVATAILAFSIPLCQIEWQFGTTGTPTVMEQVLTPLAEGKEMIDYPFVGESTTLTIEESASSYWNTSQILLAIYILGFSILLLRFIINMVNIRRQINRIRSKEDDCFPAETYSFFHHVFLHPKHRGENEDLILEHEMAHVRQWHSLDIVIMEIISIINWFNPAIYLYKESIREVHEYLADQHVIRSTPSKYRYACLLAGEMNSNFRPGIRNHFASLIKKRLKMLASKKSKKRQMFRYMSIIPVVFILLALFSLKGMTGLIPLKHVHQEGDSYELKWGDIKLTTKDFGYSMPHFEAAISLDVMKKTNINELEYSINGKKLSLKGKSFRLFFVPMDEKGEINQDPMVIPINTDGSEKSRIKWSRILDRIDEYDRIYIEKVVARYRDDISEYTDLEVLLNLEVSDKSDKVMKKIRKVDKGGLHPHYQSAFIGTRTQYLDPKNLTPEAEDYENPYSPLTDQDKFIFVEADKKARLKGCEAAANSQCLNEKVKEIVFRHVDSIEKLKKEMDCIPCLITMDESGKIVDVYVELGDARLKKAEEEIKSSFFFSPAVHNGKPVKFKINNYIKLK